MPLAASQDRTLSDILEIDKSFSAGRESDQNRNRDFLQHSIKQMDEQIDVLTEQQKKEELGLQEDTQELQRTTELFNKGTVPITRVTDARRAVLLSSTRRLQTAAQLMQVRRNRAEFSRDVEKSDDQRRIDLLTELRDATVKLASERAKLEKIQEKLALAGVALPSRQDGSATPELTVHRRGQDELKAGFDLELQPGDVVEIVYRQEQVESRNAASAASPLAWTGNATGASSELTAVWRAPSASFSAPDLRRSATASIPVCTRTGKARPDGRKKLGERRGRESQA